MSDSDDDFLLPDNSKHGKPSGGAKHPATFSATPTPVSMEPTPIGFPGSNADYASGLLAARRRNLGQHASRSGGPSPAMGRTASPTSATSNSNAMAHPLGGSMVPPVSPLVSPAQLAAPTAVSTESSQPPSTYNAEDEALMKILNPTPFPVQGRRGGAEPAAPRPEAVHGDAVAASPHRLVGSAPPVAAAAATVVPPVAVDAARIEQLRAELEAKKRTLAQLREKEDAFTERVRAEKANKLAALQSAEAQVKKQWDDLEREKDRIDTEFRRDEEAQEAFLRKERQRIEEEETAKHMPRLEALRTKHRVLQEEEAALRQTLQSASANKDLVTTAISNAVSEILKKVKELFAQSDQPRPASAATPSPDSSTMSDLKEWEASVRSMVRTEIRTAFVSSVTSAAETERSEFAKSFEEMLRFWKEAEEEERHHVTRMDEQLLLDLQSMAHEDLDRLQREENALEEMFLQSREQWTLHHQKMLHDELDAVMARRSKELEAQRALRNELHQRRLRGIEEAHAQKMEHEKAVHAKKLELIRSEQQMLERVHEAKLDMVKKVREDANGAMEGIHGAVDMLSTTVARMRELQRALDDMRGSLDRDRQKSLELREETLSHVQGLIVAQATAVEHERTVLGTALVKLDVTQAAVDRQLEQERHWVAETQAKLERSRGEWEREYRRWQHTAAQEKRNAEQRFSDVLLQLGDANAQLEQESRDLEIEGNAMRRACAERSAAVTAEMVAVEKKEEELSDKHQRLLLLLADLEAKSRDLSSEWQQTLLQRQELATQRGELEREEMKLAQMTEQLDFMKRQVDHTNYETREAALRGRSFEAQLEASREVARDGLDRVRRHAEQTLADRQQQQGRNQENHGTSAMKPQHRGQHSMSNPDRLPLRVLSELRDSLAPRATHHRKEPQHHRDPAASAAPAPQQRQPQSSSGDAEEEGDVMTHTAGAASSYHFTNLVGVSDAESTAISQQTSS